MNKANEIRKHSSRMAEAGVTVDWMWQRIGYTSMNSFIVGISVDSGKVLDVKPMSRYRKSCSSIDRILKYIRNYVVLIMRELHQQ